MRPKHTNTAETSQFIAAEIPLGQQLYDAVFNRNYPRAYALLRKLREPLSGNEAASCLSQALFCTPRLFTRILEHCAPGEYADTLCVKDCMGREFEATGTILMLAAVLDHPAHAQILLEYGYDCNSASLASAQALHRHVIYSDPGGFAAGFQKSAPSGSTLSRNDTVTIYGCTPLAAAIAADSIFAEDLLLHTPGVWIAESSAVCRAAALAVHDQEPLFTPFNLFPDSPSPFQWDSQMFFETHPMQPSSFADFCKPELLEAQYRGGQCSAEEVRRILHVFRRCLSEWREQYLEEKLLLTVQYFPEICREPDALDLLLHAYLHFRLAAQPAHANPRLLDAWKQLSGSTGDLSGCISFLGEHLYASGKTWKDPSVKALFAELAKGIRLVVSADVCPDGLLRHPIHVLPSPFSAGCSNLAADLIYKGSVSRFRGALFHHALQGESAENLLKLSQHTETPALRALILSADLSVADPVYPLERTRPNFRRYLPQKEEFPERCLCAGADLKDCITEILLLCQSWYTHNLSSLFYSYRTADGLTAQSIFSAACCGENPVLVQALLLMEPSLRFSSCCLEMQSGAFQSLTAAPLCAAAAAGRLPQLRLLLEQGASPEEFDQPLRSVLTTQLRQERLATTPLLTAILFGRLDAARLLMEAGARCDFRDPHQRRLLVIGGSEALRTAEQLPGTGLETLSPAEMTQLRLAAALGEAALIGEKAALTG